MRISKSDIFYMFMLLALGIMFFVLPVTQLEQTIFNLQDFLGEFSAVLEFFGIADSASITDGIRYFLWSLPILSGLAFFLCLVSARGLSKFFGFLGILANLICALALYFFVAEGLGGVHNLFYVYAGTVVLALISLFTAKKVTN